MPATPLEVVDTHVHLYDMDVNRYPWRNDPKRKLTGGSSAEELPRNHLVADLLREIDSVDVSFKVTAVVQVEGGHDPSDFVRETRWLNEVHAHPDSRGFPQAIVAGADLAAPDAEAVLAGHAAFASVRGIRQALHRRLGDDPPYDPLGDERWLANFGLLRKYGLSFDLQAFPRQLDAVSALVRRHADTLFILPHCALPLWSDGEAMAAWRTSVKRYAGLPNTAIKIGGFGMWDKSWNEERISPTVETIMEAFGAERCMLSSNFPPEGLVKPYAEIWRTYRSVFSRLSDDEREKLFSRNAKRLYRIEAPP